MGLETDELRAHQLVEIDAGVRAACRLAKRPCGDVEHPDVGGRGRARADEREGAAVVRERRARRPARPAASDGRSPGPTSGRTARARTTRRRSRGAQLFRPASSISKPSSSALSRAARTSVEPGAPPGPSFTRAKARKSRSVLDARYTAFPSGEKAPLKLPGPSCGVRSVSLPVASSTRKRLLSPRLTTRLKSASFLSEVTSENPPMP